MRLLIVNGISRFCRQNLEESLPRLRVWAVKSITFWKQHLVIGRHHVEKPPLSYRSVLCKCSLSRARKDLDTCTLGLIPVISSRCLQWTQQRNYRSGCRQYLVN